MRSLAEKPQSVRQAISEDANDIPTPLTQGELAERLGVDISAIRRHNKAGDLDRWSRKVDPDGISWRHQPDRDAFPSKIFVPIIEEKNQPGKQPEQSEQAA